MLRSITTENRLSSQFSELSTYPSKNKKCTNVNLLLRNVVKWSDTQYMLQDF